MEALRDVSLDLLPGERLALVGENGAGKSTLMNVLYGLVLPDGGEVQVDGKPLRLRGPRHAIELGIGMVHQHFMLVPTLTVAENVVLGREPTRRFALDAQAACRQVEETCRRFGFVLDPTARVDTLSVGSQQKVEIVKALHRGAQTLILDEPTAVLTPQEVDELFAVTRALAQAGHTVILISHKLAEVLAFADRIAVLRRGQKVAETTPAKSSAEQLAGLMVGQPMRPASPPAVSAPGRQMLGLQEVFVTGAHGRPALRGITLAVHAGEIVGIAGVDGNGQRELAELVTGLRPVERGRLTLAGQAVGPRFGPAEARERGVAHVPEDRLLRAVVAPMTVEENVSLGRQHRPPFARGPLIDFAGRRQRATQLIERFDVRPPEPRARVQQLSGGNQQKVVVARELDTAPHLLVVVQPTRGLDIAAVQQVREQLLQERTRGAGVLLVSLDLEEVLALSDRLYVLYDGRITAELSRESFDERLIGQAMLGTREAARG